MSDAPDISTRFVLDTKGLADVRRLAKNNDPGAIKTVAQQFEGMFLNILLKSMRATVPQDGMFDNQQTQMYTSLLDEQLAQEIATHHSLGLAKVLEQQLRRQQAGGTEPASQGDKVGSGYAIHQPAPAYSLQRPQPAYPLHVPSQDFAVPTDKANTEAASGKPGDFVNRLWPHAVQAGNQLGVPPHFLIAHAALETGWGKKELLNPDGSPTYNLFGVKAGSSWKGKTVDATTTEYVNGVARKQTERFRVYNSYEDAFSDYATMLQNNPRFSGVFEDGAATAADFAKGLQNGGYATDPAYASKLMRVIGSTTLRSALLA